MAALTSAGSPSRGPPPADLLPSHAPSFPDLLPPTTPTGLIRASVFAQLSARLAPDKLRRFASRLVATAVAESYSLVVAVELVLSVASHPASRRRSYFKFSQAQRRPPAGVSHPRRGRCSTAHQRHLPGDRWAEAMSVDVPPIGKVGVSDFPNKGNETTNFTNGHE